MEGICATRESAERLAGGGFLMRAGDVREGIVFDAFAPEPALAIHCLSTRGGGVEDYRALYIEGLRTLLRRVRPRRVVFVSSTSVYGQADGSWVDETSPAEPGTATGKILREAEEEALAAGGVVLRLAGLYGPGRSVFLRKFLSGEARRSDARWVNQIHRDDAAAAVLAAAGLEPGVYNVCDNTPATPAQLYSWLAEFLARPLPPEGEEPASRRRGASNKRVSNARLRARGWQPRFPSYRHALPELTSALPQGS